MTDLAGPLPGTLPDSPFGWIALACLACAALPAALVAVNVWVFRGPRRVDGEEEEKNRAGRPRVSLLIPARDEAGSIGECLGAALGSRGVDLEIVVLDDHSTDGTGEIVAGAAKEDGRVRLEQAPPLPAGWCGKQWACRSLARLADPSRDLLCFIDADVRLAPDALARLCARRRANNTDLLSAFPREVCGTAAEAAAIPLIHFLLLGFLPIPLMRRLAGPAWAAGCGQVFLTTRAAYERSGGHDAVKASLHDGLTLPRAYRRSGLTTDAVDGADLATCRMYEGAAETFEGLAKNATEGVAAPGLIGFFTTVLGLGQVLPVPLLLGGVLGELTGLWELPAAAGWTLAAAAGMGLLTRAVLAVRYRQPRMGVVLHPFGVAFFLAVQWVALTRKLRGTPAAWRGRTYDPAAEPAPAPPAPRTAPAAPIPAAPAPRRTPIRRPTPAFPNTRPRPAVSQTPAAMGR